MSGILKYVFSTYLGICHDQVVVSSTSPLERDDVEVSLLGEYTGNMPLDQKFDITYEPGYLRGRWITLVDDRSSIESLQSHSHKDHSLMVAELRVYGSKCLYVALQSTQLK